MVFEGDIEVINGLFQQKELIAGGSQKQSERRFGLVVLPGAMTGTVSAGYSKALARFGFHDIFDFVCGISAGAAVLAYFLGGSAEYGSEIFHRYCSQKIFLSKRRYLLRQPIMDTHYLMSVFRGTVGYHGLNLPAIQTSRTEFHIGVTDMEGGGHFLSAKQVPDMISLIHASLAIPGISHGPVTVNGTQYVDGGIAMPFPVERIIRQYEPTDLLILPNMPKGFDRLGLTEQVFSRSFFRNYPRRLLDLFLCSDVKRKREYNYLKTQGRCRYAILWGDGGIWRLEGDAGKLEHATRLACAELEGLLQEVSNWER